MKEGKYYSLKHINYKGLYYFKIKNIIGDDIYPNGYYINNGMFFKCADKYRFENSDKWEFKEVSESFVLNFLPDNHPDKITYIRNKKIKILLQ